MTAPTWRHSEPLPQPTRHRMRGRTDFEDSLLSARREQQYKEKRRLQALSEALRARGVASDPDGSQFRAAREQAIAARRAENARLDAMLQAAARRAPSASGDFTVSQLDAWDDAPQLQAEVDAGKARPVLQWLGLAVVAACMGLAASLAFPEIFSRIAGS